MLCRATELSPARPILLPQKSELRNEATARLLLCLFLSPTIIDSKQMSEHWWQGRAVTHHSWPPPIGVNRWKRPWWLRLKLLLLTAASLPPY